MTFDPEPLEGSFDLLAPRGEELVDEFYARLFATAPTLRPLFPTDLKQQKAMLLATLVLLRKSLRNLDGILPTLRRLGARHVAYGAQPEHYRLVGATLIASMAALAGSAWKPEYERAWTAAFEVVAASMLEGAARPELEAACVIRHTTDDDGAPPRLAEPGGRRPVAGPAPIAEIDHVPVAAVSPADGRVIADPPQQIAIARQLAVHAPCCGESALAHALAPQRPRAALGTVPPAPATAPATA